MYCQSIKCRFQQNVIQLKIFWTQKIITKEFGYYLYHSTKSTKVELFSTLPSLKLKMYFYYLLILH